MTSRALTAELGVFVATTVVAPLVLKTTPSDLDLYLWPEAEIMVGGHPLLVYATYTHALNQNDNGPLGLLPLVPMATLANALGWSGSLTGRAALGGADEAGPFVLLLAYQTVRFVAAARGNTQWPLTVAATVLLAPALWIAILDYGHIEQPVELCLVLFAVGCSLRGQNALSGVAFGGAILARTIAGFCVIPLVLVDVAGRRLRAAATIVIATLLTIAAGITPFVLANAPAVTHALLTYRASLPDQRWFVLDRRESASWAGIVRSGDVYLGAAVATVLVASTLLRRPFAGTTHAGLIGLVTVASCCVPLFAKSVFPYYFFEPYLFAVLWWLARPGTALNWRAVVPLLLTIDVFIAMAATASPFSAAGAAESVIASVVVGAAMALVMFDLLRAPDDSSANRVAHEASCREACGWSRMRAR